MWSVVGFLCPRLLDDTHPLRLTESFLLLVKFDKQYEKGMMCFSLTLYIQSLQIFGAFGLLVLFLSYSHEELPLDWITNRNWCNNCTFNILVMTLLNRFCPVIWYCYWGMSGIQFCIGFGMDMCN